MIPKFVRKFLERRRFPTLLVLGAVLFIANLLVPDPIPFVDEALMLIATVLIGSIRAKKQPERDPPDDPPERRQSS